MPTKLDTTAADFESRFAGFLASKRELRLDVAEETAKIIADVQHRGDAALIELTRKFDRFPLTNARIRLSSAEIADAARACPASVVDAIAFAAERIADYHRRLLPSDLDYRDSTGVRLGAKWLPLAAVGVYVPGGTAAYPSSVLMNAIPARVAGVGRIAMVVPTPDGAINPAVMAAARKCGLDEVYRVGGAQAVAALAFGTDTIAPVDKIVGPGNAFVAAAKRQLFGTVGIDLIAGPSEVLVIADKKNDPAWIAADLLSQAEHDEAAQAILVADDAGFAAAVEAAIQTALGSLAREKVATRSWEQHGAVIRVRDLNEAAIIANRVAAEHLELAVEDPDKLLPEIHHAGAIFLGRYSPEAVGDYVAGPNHVLPTARSARFASGLGVHDFLKRTSVIGCDATSLAALAPAIVALAQAEGLDAHARSVLVRLNRPATE